MDTRKSFLKKAIGAMALGVMSGGTRSFGKIPKTMRTNKPHKTAVIWYSQAGHTEKYGRCVAKTLAKNGLRVTASDYRDFDKRSIPKFDLIFFGSPVYYYDVPGNFQNWLRSIPRIDGTPVAGYVSYGGAGGNQQNTVCTLLNLVIEKGGVPVNMGMFGNMSTYAPTWSIGNEERILKYKHLPNKKTYLKVADYALKALHNVKANKAIDVIKEADLREKIKGDVSILLGAKIFTFSHSIDKSNCIQCGTCTKKCPTGAINHKEYSVNTGACIYCYGCVNNCPAQAINMTFMGRKVFGFKDFVQKHNITLQEPA